MAHLAEIVDGVHHGMKSKARHGKHKVDRVEVHKAKGGFITRTHYNNTGSEYREPEEAIHKSLHGVKGHLEGCYGEPEEDNEKGEM